MNARPRSQDEIAAHVLKAYRLGHELDLSGCVYGPTTDARRSFLNETMPYYRLLAGHVAETNASRIVEIGTHYGGSALAMAAGFRGNTSGRIVTMDIAGLEHASLRSDPRITKVVGDATELGFVRAVAARFPSPEIDLLYIDALKTPDFVLRTMRNVYDAGLRPNWLILDDIQTNGSMRALWSLLETEDREHTFLISDAYPEIRGPEIGYAICALDGAASLLARTPALMAAMGIDAGGSGRAAWRFSPIRNALAQDQPKLAPQVDSTPSTTLGLLRRLAREHYTGDGDIVDLGSYLGGSTRALCDGLAENRAITERRGRIHAFDEFRHEHAYLEKYVEGRVTLGESTLRLFYDRLGEWAGFVNAVPMSLRAVRWCGRPIELMVASNLRTPNVNAHVYAEFMPHMMIGKSLLVGSDLLSPHRPFTTYAFASLMDSFEIVGVYGTAVIAGLAAPVRQAALTRIVEDRFDADARVDLVERLAERMNSQAQADAMQLQAGWVALSSGLTDRAVRTIRTIECFPSNRGKPLEGRLTRLRAAVARETST